MSDVKVFSVPDAGYSRGTDSALWASLATRNNDMMPMMAMMNGGMGGQWNNPFIYLVWMMFAQRMWGNGWGDGFGGGQGVQNVEVQGQLAAIREQLNSNQATGVIMDAIKGNSSQLGQLASQLNCDFNTLNSAICDVKGGIDKVAGAVGFSAERVINAVQSGNCQLANQLSECCCSIRDAITRQGYENQLATVNQTNVLQNSLNTVNNSVERGFSATAFETARQTCDIQKSIADSTAQILAGQRAAEMRELQRDLAERDREIAKKDVIINNGQQTAVFSQMIGQATAPIAAAVNNLQSDVNGIKCKLPETTTIPYSPVVGVPSCLAAQFGLGYGLGFNTFGQWG